MDVSPYFRRLEAFLDALQGADIEKITASEDTRKSGIQPQGDEKARVGVGVSRPSHARADLVIQQRKIQRLDVSPDTACGVIGLEQFL